MAYQKSDYVLDKMQRTRENLVTSGRRLVEEGGWKNCTVTRVAQEAGVATGSLYTYFKDITDLNMDIYRQIADEELGQLSAIANSDESAADRLAEAVIVFTSRALRGRVKAYAQISEPLNPKMEKVKNRYVNSFISQFELIIRDGVIGGEFPPQIPEITATAIFGGLAKILIKCLEPNTGGFLIDERKLTGEILQLCRRTVGL